MEETKSHVYASELAARARGARLPGVRTNLKHIKMLPDPSTWSGKTVGGPFGQKHPIVRNHTSV